MHQLFLNIYNFIQNNKKIAISLSITYLGLMAFIVTQLKFEEDITRIIPKSEKSSITSKVLKQVNFSDKITVLIEKDKNTDTQELINTADTFVSYTDSLKEYYNTIQGAHLEENFSNSYQFIYQNLPLFLDKSDYELIKNKINKDSISKILNENLKTLSSPSGMMMKDFILNDPLGITFIALKKLQKQNLGSDFIIRDGYILTKDESKLLLFISPKFGGSETEKNTLFVEKLNDIKSKTTSELKNKTTISYFGAPFIAVANAKQIKHDILTTIIISLTTLLLILIFFYKKWLMPIIVFIPTLFGVGTALFVLYLLKDTLSAISLSVGAILLGVTIDYSLHILTHYKSSNNIEKLYKEISKPIIMSSSTTALAFLCLLFVNSEALVDLGIFASISVFVSAIFSLILIPHIYKPNQEISQSHFISKIANIEFEKSKVLFFGTLALIIVSIFTFNKVNFSNNISKLNFFPEEFRKTESKLEQLTNVTSKSIYVTVHANNIDSCLTINNQLNKELNKKLISKKIKQFSSIGNLILDSKEQLNRIKLWNEFWKINNKENIYNKINSEAQKLGFKENTFVSFQNILNKSFNSISIKDYKKLSLLNIDEFISNKNGFYTITTLVKLDNKNRDALVKELELKPNIITIDRQNLNETFLGKLIDDFNTLINYSFIATFIILIVFFKRIELVLVSLIPIVLTGMVTAGLMAIFGIQLNIFSTIVCTLVFGHGVDFTIFMTSALQHEYTYGKTDMKTCRASIILAALTTVLAIGALIFAKHPALVSISSVALIGVFSAMFITFVFYPRLYKFIFFRNPNNGKSNTTILHLIFSSICFFYYGFGGLFFSFIGRYLLLILPISKNKKIELFGKIISWHMKSVLYTFPMCKKTLSNPNNEDFKKPAIIIANHASFLDTLSIGQLYYKMIFFVNDWVYKSPIFGGIVKMAGYYPVKNGIEDSLESISKRIKDGSHVVIFPEGTRSRTNKIGRFHKGAFYLAEQLNVDILPIYLHGNSDLIPKGYFSIFSGSMNIVIGKRISIQNENFGSSLREKTKAISKLYKSNFEKVRIQFENETYFFEKVKMAFRYKEFEIENAINNDLNTNKFVYFELNQLLDNEGVFTLISNDYGQLNMLLTLSQPSRNIISYILENDKYEIAKTLYINKIRNITYIDSLYTNNDSKILVITSNTELNVDFLNSFTTIIILNSIVNCNLDNSFIKIQEYKYFTKFTKSL